MKAYTTRKKPDIVENKGWIKYSDPVLCFVKWLEPDPNDVFDEKKITKKGFCICRFAIYEKGDHEWIPNQNHLQADHYGHEANINPEYGFKVLKWSHLPTW